jgi:large subunit ribosomal protein L9e
VNSPRQLRPMNGDGNPGSESTTARRSRKKNLSSWAGWERRQEANEPLFTVKVSIKTRTVTVEGPRGKLVKDLGHLAVNFTQPKKNVISIEIHHGNRKNVATLRTVRTLINNLIVGVTKGFKYKMRYVYAHFPINVNVEKNNATGLFEVEIRNFIGEKIVRRVVMQPGVDVEISKNQKDELVLFGNGLENVSQSAADIQQICRVRNKDIRKFLDGLYVSEKGNVVEE